MTQILTALSFWLHAIATIVLIGHYLLLTLIYLPVFAKNQADPAGGKILSEISKRSKVFLYASLGVFFITGICLMFVDPNYQGIGKFGNLWSILMLVKHILVLGMLGMGFWYNAVLRVGPQMISKTGSAQAFVRFQQYSILMALAGVLILFLTAISQVL
jgi:uncharacterized membrane protein